jgi:hypothetical protein
MFRKEPYLRIGLALVFDKPQGQLGQRSASGFGGFSSGRYATCRQRIAPFLHDHFAAFADQITLA